MKLILVRHGITKENKTKKVLGQNPGHLTMEGEQQVFRLKKKLQGIPIDAAYCSDLKRCKDTAKILLADTRLHIKFDSRFRETNFGDYQGGSYDLVSNEHLSNLDKPFPSGESNSQMIKRVIDAVNEIINQGNIENALIISHSGPISVIVAAHNSLRFSDTIDNKIDFSDFIYIRVSQELQYPE